MVSSNGIKTTAAAAAEDCNTESDQCLPPHIASAAVAIQDNTASASLPYLSNDGSLCNKDKSARGQSYEKIKDIGIGSFGKAILVQEKESKKK